MTKNALAMALGDENWGEKLAGGQEKKKEIKLSSSVYIKPIEIGLNLN